MNRDELRQRALKWFMMHNGRSGRTARQFIDHFIGELARGQ
jgi:predicted AAA+ superfamily ATPase